MSYINRNRPYYYGPRDASFITSSSSQPAPGFNIGRPHTTDRVYSSIIMEPPVLFLSILFLGFLIFWIAYGIYYSVCSCVGQQVISRLDLAMGSKGRVLTKRRAKTRSKPAKDVRWIVAAKGKGTTESGELERPGEEKTDGLWGHGVSSETVRILPQNDLDGQQDVLLRRKSAV
ncbi:hypothetical protein ACMFMF_004640 [Clarireedia jacksonii]